MSAASRERGLSAVQPTKRHGPVMRQIFHAEIAEGRRGEEIRTNIAFLHHRMRDLTCPERLTSQGV